MSDPPTEPTNVVSITGGDVLRPDMPANAYVVQEMERLLEMARSGEIQGILTAYLHRDEVANWSACGYLLYPQLLGQLHRCERYVHRQWDIRDDERNKRDGC